jgi:hypothetical protein
MEDLFKKVELVVRHARQAKEESRSRGEQFNMFHACGVGHYENSHSSIIAELLNPQGSHGQGTIFLDAFLASQKLDIKFLLDKGASVFTEYTVTDGRIDILITNPYRQAVIIENKIYAQDQPKQLKRYDKYVHDKYGKGKYAILYLTLMGDKASEYSGGGVKYAQLSYASDIVEWLEDCIKISARLPIIRETLIQYQNHILKLTNQSMDRTEQKQLFGEMMKHAEETEAIINAASNGYFEYVWACKVKPNFEKFAADNHLLYVELDTCIYFHRPEWKYTAVKICSEGGLHHIGVSCTIEGGLEHLHHLPQEKLSCMSGRPTEWCPYGWQQLAPYELWCAGCGIIPAMIDGRFSDFIIGKVQEILNEIDTKNFKMI